MGRSRVIFHLDMDAFYASVEQRDDPELKGRPVIVGSPTNQRGVVCAASYEARKFGVRSAMPSATAGRLCPQGVFLRPAMDKYRAESHKIMKIVAETGAVIEQMSVDEAYLDMTAVVDRAGLRYFMRGGTEADTKLFQAVPLAKQLQTRIRDERNLTTSIGIAANKLLAKLGSDFNKPHGITLIPERDKALFLRPISVRDIYGVGKVTEQALKEAGLRTVGDVQDYKGNLRSLLGSFGVALAHYARGEDDRPVETDEGVKSVSAEHTFLKDTGDKRVIAKILKDQAKEIAERLDRKELNAHTIQVKVRYSDFTTLTRQVTTEDAVITADAIFRLGAHLLKKENLVSQPLRLIGLGVRSLSERTSEQMGLRLGV